VTYAFEIASSSRPSIEAVARQRSPAFRTKDSVRSNRATNARSESYTAAVAPEETQVRNALEEMFVASRSRFLAMAYSILQNREDAEEAVQEAFISAHRHLRKFEGRSALKTWLTRIVLNAALMMRRKRKPIAIRSLSDVDASTEEDWTENIPDLHPNPEMIHAEGETFQFIDGILEKMKPVLRQAFTMTYYDDLSREEASAKLRVSVGTFKARLFRARRLVLHKTKRARIRPTHKALATSSESWKRRGLHGFQSPEL
jgi:RNA polymerase sigma-70 factor (ECF subfamily)